MPTWLYRFRLSAHQLCDFGLARADRKDLTTYVVTRNYRAPELLVGNKVTLCFVYESALRQQD